MSGCGDCGVTLGRDNKSGYCKRHISAALARDPVWREKQATAARAKLRADPVRLAKTRANAIAMGKLPHAIAARREDCTRRQLWKIGAEHQTPPGSPERQKAGARRTATILAWCPANLRDEYRQLANMRGVSAVEARQMIEDQHELEMARWRRSIGAPVEALEQAEPTIIDPLTSALDLAARLFKVTPEQILSAARSRKFTMPRYAIAVALKRQGLTTTAIANKLGKNDHTSALHWIKRGEYLEASERKFAAKVVAISGCWAPVEAAA